MSSEYGEGKKQHYYSSAKSGDGMIHSHIQFAEAAANGSRSMCEFLLENGSDIDAPGRDGTTALCAAALWGNDGMVNFLLDKGADPNARNEGTGWTALHAAAFQEHGKVVRILLDHGSDPENADCDGRTPVDYATISDAIWAFFAARGYKKSSKKDLVEKGIIKKVENQEPSTTSNPDNISFLSRPGSAYIRAQNQPPTASKVSSKLQLRDGKVAGLGPIDPLGDIPSYVSNQRRPSFQSLGL